MALDSGENEDFTVEWYAICGILLAAVAFLVGAAVAAYKCYNRYNAGSDRQLSSAIRKGIKETNNGSMKKSPSQRSTSVPARGTRSFSSPHIHQDQQGGVNIPEKRSPCSSTGQGNIDPTSLKQECYIENETDEKDAVSPVEKDVTLRETSEDELKKKQLGQLYFALEYDKARTALVVTVTKATDLPIKDTQAASSDPYVKLQLLPDKRHKVKTRVLRKTLNPIYDEIFTFYGISLNQLQSVTLHFVVLSFDRFSRDDIIGEVVWPLSEQDVGEGEVTLCKEIQPRHMKIHSHGRGELLVSLCYQPAANRLTVVVLKARNLPKMDITGLSDPYIKVYLLYNGQRIAKKKTHVKKRTLNPVYNESFLFDVPCNEGLHNISLEFLILDWDRMTKNEVIGRLDLGIKSPGPESHHWSEVMNCPRKQIAEWHKLKE